MYYISLYNWKIPSKITHSIYCECNSFYRDIFLSKQIRKIHYSNNTFMLFAVAPRKKKEFCGMAKPVSEISLSSNDSTEKTTVDYSKRLQSPIESHFAVTPTIDSKTSSPANGFTSAECGQLLCEELDNLAIDDQSKQTHQSKESIACSDDIVPINSTSTSIEDLKEKKHSLENSTSKESISFSDDLVPIHSTSISVENLKFDSKKGSDTASEKSMSQLNDLLSPAEESISMFTQLSNKLTEITAEGDSGVDTTHNFSDDETCKPEVNIFPTFLMSERSSQLSLF